MTASRAARRLLALAVVLLLPVAIAAGQPPVFLDHAVIALRGIL